MESLMHAVDYWFPPSHTDARGRRLLTSPATALPCPSASGDPFLARLLQSKALTLAYGLSASGHPFAASVVRAVEQGLLLQAPVVEAPVASGSAFSSLLASRPLRAALHTLLFGLRDGSSLLQYPHLQGSAANVLSLLEVCILHRTPVAYPARIHHEFLRLVRTLAAAVLTGNALAYVAPIDSADSDAVAERKRILSAPTPDGGISLMLECPNLWVRHVLPLAPRLTLFVVAASIAIWGWSDEWIIGGPDVTRSPAPISESAGRSVLLAHDAFDAHKRALPARGSKSDFRLPSAKPETTANVAVMVQPAFLEAIQMAQEGSPSMSRVGKSLLSFIPNAGLGAQPARDQYSSRLLLEVLALRHMTATALHVRAHAVAQSKKGDTPYSLRDEDLASIPSWREFAALLAMLMVTLALHDGKKGPSPPPLSALVLDSKRTISFAGIYQSVLASLHTLGHAFGVLAPSPDPDFRWMREQLEVRNTKGLQPTFGDFALPEVPVGDADAATVSIQELPLPVSFDGRFYHAAVHLLSKSAVALEPSTSLTVAALGDAVWTALPSVLRHSLGLCEKAVESTREAHASKKFVDLFCAVFAPFQPESIVQAFFTDSVPNSLQKATAVAAETTATPSTSKGFPIEETLLPPIPAATSAAAPGPVSAAFGGLIPSVTVKQSKATVSATAAAAAAAEAAAAAAAAAAEAARPLSVPGLALPIAAHRYAIVKAIAERTVCIVKGDTGSGKSSQVPQYILDAGARAMGKANALDYPPLQQSIEEPGPLIMDSLVGVSELQPAADGSVPDVLSPEVWGGRETRMFVMQPRRVAAVSLAQRIAQERKGKMGDVVGYRIGNDRCASDATRITLCTTGWMLQFLIGTTNERLEAVEKKKGYGDSTADLADGELGKTTHVICDEVHERSIDTVCSDRHFSLSVYCRISCISLFLHHSLCPFLLY
jgi:hypothetical protein